MGARLIIVIVVCSISGFLFLRVATYKSLDRADSSELTEAVERWFESNRPEGTALNTFMSGRRPDLVFTNRLVTINGTNYTTIFALTRSRSGRAGVLFV